MPDEPAIEPASWLELLHVSVSSFDSTQQYHQDPRTDGFEHDKTASMAQAMQAQVVAVASVPTASMQPAGAPSTCLASSRLQGCGAPADLTAAGAQMPRVHRHWVGTNF